MTDTGALTIGEVINLLKGEFPEVTVSKVRFLEDQGLIFPSRSASGYRQFHEHDLRRLRFILRQQRDHYLPLKVIKSRLTMWERGEEPATIDGEAARSDDRRFDASDGEFQREDLERLGNLSGPQLDRLIEHGILPDAASYDELHVAIAEAAGRMLAIGLEARHLRSVRIAAERAADLLESLTEPQRRHRSPESVRQVHETLSVGTDGLVDIYRHVVVEQLRDVLND